MTEKNTGLWVALIAVAIIAMIGVFTPAKNVAQQMVGGVTNYDEVDATAIKIGGSSGSRVGPVIANTCSLIGVNAAIAASTSVAFDCAVTGVVTGDYVFAQFATSSANGAGWLVTQSSASSTSGFITLRIVNNTGVSAYPPASVASTTQYLVLHPRSTVPGL